METIEGQLDQYGLLAVVLVMLAKSAGAPIPVPGDAIVLAVAARAAQGKMVPWQAFVGLLLAALVGGTLQFALARGPARGALYRFGRHVGLTPARLDSAVARVQRVGVLGLGLAILTPGVRGATIAACGLAGQRLSVFLPALALGTSADVALHFGMGYLGGSLLERVDGLPSAAMVLLVALPLGGLAAWLLLRRRQRRTAPAADLATDALRGWTEACCPLCLALVAARGATADSRPAPAPTPSPQPWPGGG